MTNLDPEVIDTIRTSSIGTTGVTYSLFGLPFHEIAAILTAIYMFFKVVMLLPKMKEFIQNLFKRKT